MSVAWLAKIYSSLCGECFGSIYGVYTTVYRIAKKWEKCVRQKPQNTMGVIFYPLDEVFHAIMIIT